MGSFGFLIPDRRVNRATSSSSVLVPQVASLRTGVRRTARPGKYPAPKMNPVVEPPDVLPVPTYPPFPVRRRPRARRGLQPAPARLVTTPPSRRVRPPRSASPRKPRSPATSRAGQEGGHRAQAQLARRWGRLGDGPGHRSRRHRHRGPDVAGQDPLGIQVPAAGRLALPRHRHGGGLRQSGELLPVRLPPRKLSLDEQPTPASCPPAARPSGSACRSSSGSTFRSPTRPPSRST